MTLARQLLDLSADAPPVVVAVLGGVAAFLVVLAIGVQWSARELQQELDRAQEELTDRRTGLLPRSATRIRLGAELAWAASSNVPVAIAVLQVRGGGFRSAARALRLVMREEEAAFLLGRARVVVELWGATPESAVLAVRRLGAQLRAAGHPAVDAGIACMPRDGADVQTLVRAATRDLRAIDHLRSRADDAGRMPTGAAHAWAVVAEVAPWLAAHLVLCLAWLRLLPRIYEPLHGELLWAVGIGTGVTVATALLSASTWNLGGGSAAPSRPARAAGWRTLAVLTIVQGGLVAWTCAAQTYAAQTATMSCLVLVGLIAFAVRQLHELPSWLLAAALALTGTLVWELDRLDLPADISVASLLIGASIAAGVVTRILIRPWMLALVALAGAYAATGREHLPDLLVLVGPQVAGDALFRLGIDDLLLLSLVLAWGHAWRVDTRAVGLVLAAAGAGWVFAGDAVHLQVLLAWLACAAALLTVGRVIVLRMQASSWRAAMASR